MPFVPKRQMLSASLKAKLSKWILTFSYGMWKGASRADKNLSPFTLVFNFCKLTWRNKIEFLIGHQVSGTSTIHSNFAVLFHIIPLQSRKTKPSPLLPLIPNLHDMPFQQLSSSVPLTECPGRLWYISTLRTHQNNWQMFLLSDSCPPNSLCLVLLPLAV